MEKNVGGRPRIYEKPEDLADACEQYFSQCEEKGERPLLTGLCLHLGFADKTTLYDYRDRDGFSHPIKRSLMRVEMAYEQRLEGNNVTGSIFALKNMGWKDKTETAITDPDGKAIASPVINVHVVGTTLAASEDEVEKRNSE